MNEVRANRRVSVCVDDFGLSRASCMAAVELAAQGLVSAVSSVVDGQYIESFAHALQSSQQTCTLGLHLNLTEHSAFRYTSSLRAWVARAAVARLWHRRLSAEISRQLDRFEHLYGRPPAFVDGHEHVHQLCVVREPLLEVLGWRYGSQIALRSTVPLKQRGLKAGIIARLGGYALRDAARQRHITANRDFAGVYDFSTRIPYEQRMRTWLASIADDGLIMCHPEHPGDRSRTADARRAEFEFFLSPRWRALHEEFNFQLIPFAAHS